MALREQLSQLILSDVDGRRYRPGTSCRGRSANETNFCVDTCLSSEVPDSTFQHCKEVCICHTWHREAADILMCTFGVASLCACILVFCADISKRGRRSSRTGTQSSCLRWSNGCNFYNSLYYVAYAVSDSWSPLWDESCGTGIQDLFSNQCHQAGGSPMCFLNCCFFAVPWLEFFGYGSYLWNIMWLLDLARFTLKPLAPEKVLGIPLIVFYHTATWPLAALVAFDINGARLTTNVCREARIVMMPCILRRQNMEGDLPWFHMAGFAVIGIAFAIMVFRYVNAGQLLGTAARRSQEGQHLLLQVRRYLRKQWLHFASLVFCSILILVDTSRECKDDSFSYLTSIGFAGLGLFLSLDRLVAVVRDRGREDAGPLLQESQGLGLQSTELASPRAGLSRLHHSSSRLHHSMSTSIQGAEGYRLLDFSGLLEQLIQYLRDEELQLGQQLQLLGKGLEPKQAAEAQNAILRSSACLDDNPEMQWDWTISAGSDTALTVIAPRSFVYLRRLCGVDGQKLLAELLRTNVSELRSAAKSGCSLLLSSDNTTFVLKTISRSEVKQLRAMLGPYRKHLEHHPNSMLCRVYGCFSFKNSLGYFLHAVLMNCLTGMPAALAEHHLPAVDEVGEPSIFDIKSEFQDGGFRSRFPGGLNCSGSSWPSDFEADLTFLASLGVVDYSVLLAVWQLPDELGRALENVDLPSGMSLQRPQSSGCFQLARMGIIDFLVHWDVRKRTESALKRTCLHPRHTERVTIMDPETYKRRQLAFLMAMFRNTA